MSVRICAHGPNEMGSRLHPWSACADVEGWKELNLAMLAEAGKPESLLRFVVLPPMLQLLRARSQFRFDKPCRLEAKVAALAYSSSPKDEWRRPERSLAVFRPSLIEATDPPYDAIPR